MKRVVGVVIAGAIVALALLTPTFVGLRDALRVHVSQASVLGHFGLFFGFGWALWAARASISPWVMVLLAIALATGLEFAQILLPSRAVELDDALANISGACAGLAFGAWRQRRGSVG